ncbi:hypothetical protein OsccyDRAFT_1042 [Leptolyngbyaceae cyanobacterium JSC-12]|nr:hypothetical protein OsccyDRAFT_1042 [Leptolyngbyaceae cyanobacterium JSC-12]
MNLLLSAEFNVCSPVKDSAMAYMNDVIGAAIFDLNGLPKEYFTTSDSSNMSWVQTIFQALGLRSLLISSLQLEGFHHATIQGVEHCAVVVKQRTHYIALLLREPMEEVPEDLIAWAYTFEANWLRDNPRFRVA